MTSLDIGYEFDRYRVERVLGQGGAATVFAVRHLRLDSLHALKVMRVSTASFQHRLLQEGRGQAGLRHPNVVSVFDVLDVDGAPALLMEYVEGPTLGTLIKQRRFTLGEALWLFRGIVLGVGAAHRRGLVHRDLKPDNVLLAPTNDGLAPKVTDFGLVKMADHKLSSSQLGRAVGTAPYMAPEQVSGARDIDQGADLWALGCILYELISGSRAFSGSDPLDTFNRVREVNYAPLGTLVPDLPTTVQTTVEGLLTADRSARIQSVDHLFELLFDGNLPLTRVDLDPADAATPIFPVFITDEPTAVTDVVPTPAFTQSVSTSRSIRIAPLGPDPSDERTPVPAPAPPFARRVTASTTKLPLKHLVWIPIATATLALAVVVAVFAVLLTPLTAEAPPSGASASHLTIETQMPYGETP